MAGIVHACVTPHGFEIIPDIAGEELERFAVTRVGMEELGRQMGSVLPDVIVIATPHGFRVEGAISVATTSFASGRLTKFGGAAELDVECDREMALELLRKAKVAGLPVTGATFGAASGFWSVLPLDWGSFIPLWFLGGRSERKPKVVIITTTREFGFDPLFRLGKVIAEVASRSGKRVAFVASADQGHAHDPNGLYGFHEASKVFDQLVCDAVQKDDLSPLFTLSQEFVDNAKPDSLWQMSVLHGMRDTVRMRGTLVSYQAPTYYGMMCASYHVVH